MTHCRLVELQKHRSGTRRLCTTDSFTLRYHLLHTQLQDADSATRLVPDDILKTFKIFEIRNQPQSDVRLRADPLIEAKV